MRYGTISILILDRFVNLFGVEGKTGPSILRQPRR